MKLQIVIPNNNIAERKYIIHVIISDFLKIPFDLYLSNTTENYILQFGEKSIIIKDSFFSKHKEEKSYLDEKNIPEKLLWFDYKDIKTPIIYGENTLNISDAKVECGLDIFASSFFMLSRWEEFVIHKKDTEGRCPEEAMFVVKHKIFNRAIVNEYCDLLKYLLQKIAFKITNSDRKFTVFPTHDIDFLFRYNSIFSLIKILGGDLFRRKSVNDFVNTVKSFVKFRLGKTNDPFDTFDYYMDLSEKYGYKSSFYFKPSTKGEHDATYDIFDNRVMRIISNIISRGHLFGIHPSKNTFNNKEQLQIEYDRIKSINEDIIGGRQHYLLYDLPETLNYWNDLGLLYDCGLGFYDRVGFRCGTCFSYRFFDCVNRTTLKLIQKPLHVMDVAVCRDNPDKELIMSRVKSIIDTVAKHKGEFVILWHNAVFDSHYRIKLLSAYEEILNYTDCVKI